MDGVTQVTFENAAIEVNTSVKDESGAAPLIDSLALMRAISGALRSVSAKGVLPVKIVEINVSGPTIDHLGNRVQEPMFEFFFPAADLAAANFDNLSNGGQADLASDFTIEGIGGADATRAFCDENVDSNTSDRLCTPALIGPLSGT